MRMSRIRHTCERASLHHAGFVQDRCKSYRMNLSFFLALAALVAAEPEGECATSTSRWGGVEMAPADPILGVAEAYKADTDERKINLGALPRRAAQRAWAATSRVVNASGVALARSFTAQHCHAFILHPRHSSRVVTTAHHETPPYHTNRRRRVPRRLWRAVGAAERARGRRAGFRREDGPRVPPHRWQRSVQRFVAAAAAAAAAAPSLRRARAVAGGARVEGAGRYRGSRFKGDASCAARLTRAGLTRGPHVRSRCGRNDGSVDRSVRFARRLARSQR